MPIAVGGIGQASVHETNDGMICKEMFADFPDQKVRYLINHPLVPSRNGHQFAWPIDIGIDETNEAVLYLMPKAENSVDIPAIFAAADWLPEAFRIRVALNKTRALIDLENAGYRRGDMPNAMVDPRGLVTEIDLDSLQVSRPDAEYVCGVGKGDWLAPELLVPMREGGLAEISTAAAHDSWSLAVVLWMLLRGDHPFDCRYVGPGTRPKRLPRIEQGHWAFDPNETDYEPRRGTPPLTAFDPELAFLFRQTFSADQGHSNPAARPALSAWEAVLTRIDMPGDVSLSDMEWQCVKTGSCPHRVPLRIAGPPTRKRSLKIAASVAVMGTAGLAFHDPIESGVTKFPPSREVIQVPHSMSLEATSPTPAAKRAPSHSPPEQFEKIPAVSPVNPGDVPALWKHIRETLQ